MRSFLEQARALSEFYWQGSLYRWIFYTGLLLVIVFAKRRSARMIFGWVPLCFLICLYNPLFMRLMGLAGAGDRQYFVRMFSFMPMMYTIAYGLVSLLGRLKGLTKLLAVCAACLLLCLAGRNVFGMDWYTRASNFEKVSADTLQAVEALQSAPGQDISVVTIDPVTNYMRQVANVITPYARDMDALGHLLMEDPPDVMNVMTQAGAFGYDYIMARRTKATLKAFKKAGYKPFALTDNLAIFKVEGVDRMIRVYNAKRQVTAMTCVDKNGHIQPTPAGYATVAYEYDKNYNRVRETYLDENGAPYAVDGLYTTIRRTFSPRGLLKTCAYFDADGEPALVFGRYETRYSYSPTGILTGEAYFDRDGQPMNRTDFRNASRTIQYDPNGLVIREDYYDTAGNYVITGNGYAIYTREYTADNRLARENYFGTDGKPIRIPAGYAELNRFYDAAGNIVSEVYLDEAGNRIVSSSGYAEVRREYDGANRLIRETYWGADGSPVANTGGWHGFTLTYDEAGQVAEQQYIELP